jgi:hypothetical protein
LSRARPLRKQLESGFTVRAVSLGCYREGAGVCELAETLEAEGAVEGIHGGVTLGGVDLAIGEKSESETHGKRV